MQCADFDFYVNVFLGESITQEDFPRLAQRASDYIYAVTGGISENLPERDRESVQKAVCAVAEIIQSEDRMNKKAFSGEAEVSSETVGSWSRSYRSSGFSGNEAAYLASRKREILETYLKTIPAFAGVFRVRSYRCVHDR